MKVLLNTKMAEETPVQDHVLKMISHLNELEILGQRLTAKAKSISCSCLYLSPIRTSALITVGIVDCKPSGSLVHGSVNCLN